MTNKEESLLPSAEDIIISSTPFAVNRSWITKGDDFKALEKAVKAYGEEVRRITLQEAAEKATLEVDPEDPKRPYDPDQYIVDKDSITDLNNSPRLEVR